MSARDLIPFSFEHHNVRVITGDDGEPLFVGMDICEALGYANPPDAIARHCKGVVKRYPLQTAGGVQDLRVLAEPDVMRLIVGSTLPAAEAFERWVFEEVLPSIRKTGSYGAAVTFSDDMMLALRMTPAAVRAARALGLDQNAAAIGGNRRQPARVQDHGAKFIERVRPDAPAGRKSGYAMVHTDAAG